jgi:hypothetical protein
LLIYIKFVISPIKNVLSKSLGCEAGALGDFVENQGVGTRNEAVGIGRQGTP